MKTKPSLKYQIFDMIKPLKIYYLILIAIIIAIHVLEFMLRGTMASGESDISGTGIATIVFLFVCGLCSFKENFMFLTQNCTTRKSIFTGRILATTVIAVIAAMADIIIELIQALISSSSMITNQSMYQLIYGGEKTFSVIILSFFFNFFVNIVAFAFGYFISTIFYRLGKIGKVVLSAGLPITCLYLLPILDLWLFDSKVISSIVKFIAHITGFISGRSWYMFLSCTVIFSILSGFTWLIMRKAPVRD